MEIKKFEKHKRPIPMVKPIQSPDNPISFQKPKKDAKGIATTYKQMKIAMMLYLLFPIPLIIPLCTP